MGETISWNWDAFETSFSHLPLEMGDWVVMRFLDVGQGCRFFAFTEIPDSHYSISTASSNNIG